MSSGATRTSSRSHNRPDRLGGQIRGPGRAVGGTPGSDGRATDFVDPNESHLLAYHVCFSRDGTRMSVVQVTPIPPRWSSTSMSHGRGSHRSARSSVAPWANAYDPGVVPFRAGLSVVTEYLRRASGTVICHCPGPDSGVRAKFQNRRHSLRDPRSLCRRHGVRWRLSRRCLRIVVGTTRDPQRQHNRYSRRTCPHDAYYLVYRGMIIRQPC